MLLAVVISACAYKTIDSSDKYTYTFEYEAVDILGEEYVQDELLPLLGDRKLYNDIHVVTKVNRVTHSVKSVVYAKPNIAFFRAPEDGSFDEELVLKKTSTLLTRGEYEDVYITIKTPVQQPYFHKYLYYYTLFGEEVMDDDGTERGARVVAKEYFSKHLN